MSGAVAQRGRIDKRQAILDAAFTVFAREGYARAGVDTIAAAAGVAKATVYSHFGDKETLLREAIAASADQALAENLAVLDRLTGRGDDLRATLEDVGLRMLQCYGADRSWALRRLLSAEVNQFPELLDIVHTRAADRVTQALADRLARLSVAGKLHTPDPLVAAEQFFALLTGSLERRARLGTRHVPTTELKAVARDAVATFMAAFAPKPA
ncbi:TetR/AcrR family transcriptional regulator [Kibdelosporangium phytohabitans]|uniref:TetR family transcriptional regulator n=1 Tax=Kibdelosporangium phytohabitans TaxID=860235 RepID=A0A0N9HYZ9_9PSEU|nr:TetR/AcrR family transcriptional regulator [Kibdelosporangium phytohabitans]ALG08563.1 TetR family transcriptional regulator [Kibdelosporangium phytohabitans]MBE1470358.1 AcrR family transcriptional regulator [Kibdelosporangium phytohabitans]